MRLALAEAHLAPATRDVPVGCVVLAPDGEVLSRGHNAREARRDPTAHAEVVAIRTAAAATGCWRLSGCTLVVTLEPCTMCAGALLESDVDGLVFALADPQRGAAGSAPSHTTDALRRHVRVVSGIMQAEAAEIASPLGVGR